MDFHVKSSGPAVAAWQPAPGDFPGDLPASFLKRQVKPSTPGAPSPRRRICRMACRTPPCWPLGGSGWRRTEAIPSRSWSPRSDPAKSPYAQAVEKRSCSPNCHSERNEESGFFKWQRPCASLGMTKTSRMIKTRVLQRPVRAVTSNRTASHPMDQFQNNKAL